VDLYNHYTIRLHGEVLNYLSTGPTLPYMELEDTVTGLNLSDERSPGSTLLQCTVRHKEESGDSC
jgi:hypothetical protein